ncbi:M20 family metallopeptidase [Glycomyces sp. TRM65418]|uniref:M20 metallopeptidase family protein n=1 Tax=Glycomyces sp. TRM65418 TaxID=2867006 RepID=UPI001CE6D985|nr:M20 family metallopeptidase [Glycomyces sp. TRM65418]MCC3761835.1 M20 family metallopeptidase [Glycomyces sp. TRM65418]QZD55917.1 amidohydrolase [Glycomyces sp. TRM65418]
MDFREEAAAIAPELIALRRRLHRIPEIGLDLPKTQAAVLAALAGLPLEITLGRTSTAVTAVLRGGRPGPAVLLRGDMDALPVTEETAVDYVSEHVGTMHACGHDLHTAGLVGAAKLLSAHQAELSGDVVFMFQPGEEGFDGAGHMIAEGVLEAAGRKVDAAYGLHVISDMVPRGVFTTRPGPMMAASSGLFVNVVGKGGHGSRPHTALDPIPVAAEIVTALQNLITRRFSVFEPIVITVGTFHAGTRHNIIPDNARFEATVRTFSEEALAQVEKESVQLAEDIATAHGLSAEVRFDREYPATVNDADEAAFVEATVKDLFGGERYTEMPNPVMGSEDFSRVLQAVPGSYMFYGATIKDDPNEAASNHSPRAAFDDGVLADGAALLAELAVRRMARG